MSSRQLRRAIVCALVLSGLIVSSCGGDGDEPSDATEVAQDPTFISTASKTATAAQIPEPSSSREPVVTDEAATPTATEATTPQSPTTPGPTPTVPPVPTAVPPPPPTTVTGTGTSMSAPVRLPAGLAVITMNHAGTENFIVRLQSADAGVDRIVGNGTGNWKGSIGVVIDKAGEYLFSVQSDSEWQINVMWPTPETAPVAEVPFSYAGTGDQAVYFVVVRTGQHVLSMTHDGTGSFSVVLFTSEGRRYIDRVGGVGPLSASGEFIIRDKAFEFFMLNVRATGNWTILID